MTNSEPIATVSQDSQEVVCLGCQKPFQARALILFDRKIVASKCEACADLEENRTVEWARLCPLEFRLTGALEGGGRTELARMTEAAPVWQEILAWEYGPRGLLIRGQTGRCKTRAMWRLLRHQFNQRRSVIAITSAQFDRQCRDAGGTYTLTEWFNRLAAVDVLFLDDLGKAKWTEGTEAQMFDLIDERTREGRPILATTNDSGESLAARLSTDRGEPLIRRLRDYCASYVF